MEAGARGRILVVDDDPSFARSVARLLRPLGEAVIGQTVREGVRLLDVGPPYRAAILDFALPDGSATDILRHAKEGRLLRGLVVTGQEAPEAEAAVRALGAEFLRKPVAGAVIERYVRDGTLEGAQHAGRHLQSNGTRLLSGLAVAALAELRAQYEIAEHVHRLRYPPPDVIVGRQALICLAKRLNLHPGALRKRARVSERIRPDEFELLVGLRSARGLPLTWSHFERLALVPGRTQREALARKFIDDDLGVRPAWALVKAASRERCRRQG